MADRRSPGADPALQALLQDRDRLKALLTSPEVRQLARLLDAGGTLGQAAQQAQGGDTAALEGLVHTLAQSPQGADALERMKEKLRR